MKTFATLMPRSLALLAVTGALLLTPNANAQAGDTGTSETEQAKDDKAELEDPYGLPNDTWISLSGTVDRVTPDSFALNFGDGTILVEMDDGDRDADAYKLLVGDKVRVHGMIDHDLFELRTIEASSVFVEKLGTLFFASPVDEEDFQQSVAYSPALLATDTAVMGRVAMVDAEDEELVLRVADELLKVDVGELPYNPLDDEGYHQVDVGDHVFVSGLLDDGFFEVRELEAKTVLSLNHPSWQAALDRKSGDSKLSHGDTDTEDESRKSES